MQMNGAFFFLKTGSYYLAQASLKFIILMPSLLSAVIIGVHQTAAWNICTKENLPEEYKQWPSDKQTSS
jgi:hypothetical protein